MSQNLQVNGKTVFITGGAGFIGSTLAMRLVNNNHVILYDNLTRNSLPYTNIQNHPNLTLIEGDVLDKDHLRYAMEGTDILVHCAAIAGIDSVRRSPTTTMNVNMVGSANVLQGAADLGSCERVICFSTSEVFGQQAFNSQETDVTVTGSAGEARWAYAASKLAVEHLALAYYAEYGLPTTVLRPFNVYGPGQVGDGAIRTFVLRALRGAPLEIHGDGVQLRAWCYVDDMIDASELAMVHPKAVGESFNIGNRKAVITIFGLANTILRLLQAKSEIVFVPHATADVELRVPHVEKAASLLGFEAKVDLEDGILRTAKYFERQQGQDIIAGVG